MESFTPSHSHISSRICCDSAKKPAMFLALAVLVSGTTCFGWSVSSPYSETEPLVVSPGDAGQFDVALTQGAFELPSPFDAAILQDPGGFVFAGPGAGSPRTTLFPMPGGTLHVTVEFVIPETAARGTHDLVYEFICLGDNSAVVDGFPVVVGTPDAGNTAPAPSIASCGSYEVGVDEVWLAGSVEDMDGDPVGYAWLLNDVLLMEDVVETLPGGFADLPLVPVDLGVGTYDVTLVATDGLSDPVETGCAIVFQDTTPPELTLAAEPQELRVARKWVPVTVSAEALDRSGGPITLEATVSISGFEAAIRGKGKRRPSRFAPGARVEFIDQEAGTVTLMMKPYGTKKTGYPVFEVDVTATDASGNTAASDISISVTPRKRWRRARCS